MGGFRIAEAFVSVKTDAAGLRDKTTRAVKEAGVGQEIKVGLKVDKPNMGGLMANLAPFILPSIAAVGSLSGVLGLVPAAAGAAGLAYGTLKVGLSGFGDALKKANAAKNTQELNDALKDLSPNARASALAIHSLGPAWDAAKLDVQNRLFAGMSPLIGQVAKVDLPVLRQGMDSMAEVVNRAAKYTANWLTTTKTAVDLKEIMHNSSVAGDNLARSIQPILGILRDVALVGSTFLPQLTGGFANAAQRAADFVSHARDTGKLHDWIQTGIDALHTVFDIVGNVIQIVVKLSQTPWFASGLLGTIDLVTKGILWLITNMPELVPIIAAVVAGWKAWQLGQLAVNLVMDANPIGLVITAIGLLIGIIVEMVIHWDAVKAKLNDVWNWIKNTGISIFNSFRDYWTGVWNDIQNRAWSIWDATGGALINKFNALRSGAANVWHGLVDDFNNIWGSIQGIANNIWGNVTGAFRNGVNSVIGLINRLVDGADAVLGFLHIALVPHIPALASGGVVGLAAGGRVGAGFTTNGPRAIVGEGDPNHPEYVIPTDPTHRRNALALYASLGTKLMAGGGIIDWIGSTVSKVEKWVGDGATGLMNQAVDGLAGGIPAPFHDIATSVGHQAVAAIKALIDKSQQAFSAAFTGSPNLAGWIQAALGLTGAPSSWAGPLSVLIGRESGGNPNAINLWDSNAAAGHPSQGLMQTIPGTFQAYHQAGTSWNILDPVANIAAGINYIRARYGSIFNVQQANPNLPPRGYDAGGLLPTGLSMVRNSTGRPERVLDAAQTAKLDRLLAGPGRGGGVTVNVTQVSGSPAETGRFVALALRTVA
jgi:Transglycosylase SLT domain